MWDRASGGIFFWIFGRDRLSDLSKIHFHHPKFSRSILAVIFSREILFCIPKINYRRIHLFFFGSNMLKYFELTFWSWDFKATGFSEYVFFVDKGFFFKISGYIFELFVAYPLITWFWCSHRHSYFQKILLPWLAWGHEGQQGKYTTDLWYAQSFTEIESNLRKLVSYFGSLREK